MLRIIPLCDKCPWRLVFNGLSEECTVGGSWEAINAVSDISAFENLPVGCRHFFMVSTLPMCPHIASWCRHFNSSVLALKLSPGADLGVGTSRQKIYFWLLTFGADTGVDTSCFSLHTVIWC